MSSNDDNIHKLFEGIKLESETQEEMDKQAFGVQLFTVGMRAALDAAEQHEVPQVILLGLLTDALIKMVLNDTIDDIVRGGK